MKGWPNESYRHSLASRGVRTRAIENPYAGPNHYDSEIYEKSWLRDKAKRPYKGSGLENISKWDVINAVDEFLWEFDGSKEWDEYRLRDYYDLVKMSLGKFDMPYEEFKKIYEDGSKFFEIDEVHIFGSRITGFWTPYSDVDVYIKIKPRKGIDNDVLDYMADEMRGTVEAYLADYNRTPTIYDEGRLIRVDIPIISTDPPESNFPNGKERPTLLIWEEGD